MIPTSTVSLPTTVASQGLSRQVINAVVVQFVVVMMTSLLLVVRGRLLEPSGFGDLSLILLMPAVVLSILNLGIARSNTYFVARGEFSIAAADNTSRRCWYVLSALGILCGVILIYANTRLGVLTISSPLDPWLALATYPVVLLHTFNVGTLSGIRCFETINRMRLIDAGALLLFTFAALLLTHSVSGALFAYLSSSLLITVCSCAEVAKRRQMVPEQPPVAKCGTLRSFLSYGWKSNFSPFLRFLCLRIDLVLVSYFTDSRTAGIYMVAIVIVEKLRLLPQSAIGVLFPALASQWDNTLRRDRLTRLTLRWSALGGAISAVTLAFLGPWLLVACLGGGFADAGLVLLLMLPGFVLETISLTITNDFAARGLVHLNSSRTLLFLVVNVVLNLMLIPVFGIAGAAVASTLSHLVLTATTMMVYARLSEVSCWKLLVPEAADRKIMFKLWRMLQQWVTKLAGKFRPPRSFQPPFKPPFKPPFNSSTPGSELPTPTALPA